MMQFNWEKGSWQVFSRMSHYWFEVTPAQARGYWDAGYRVVSTQLI